MGLYIFLHPDNEEHLRTVENLETFIAFFGGFTQVFLGIFFFMNTMISSQTVNGYIT